VDIKKGYKVVDKYLASPTYGAVQVRYVVGKWVFPRAISQTITSGALSVFDNKEDASMFMEDRDPSWHLYECDYIPALLNVIHNDMHARINGMIVCLHDQVHDQRGRLTGEHNRVPKIPGAKLASAVRLTGEVEP